MTWPLPIETDDFYGMPGFAIIEVSDLERSATWYHAIGFRHVFTMAGADGRPMLVHLRWMRYADLLLRPADEPLPKQPGAGVALAFSMFERDGDTVNDVAERGRAAGAVVLADAEERPWNARETTIADPDGYRLVFTQATASRATMTMTEVVEQVRRG